MGTTEELLDERFVPIADHPGYEVSNFGRVVRTKDDVEIRSNVEHHGHLYVTFYVNGKRSQTSLRRLVAEAFFADYEPWMHVFLISDNKLDCSVRNITLQNARNDTGPKKNIRIKETGEVFTSAYAAAYRIGGSASTISKVLMGIGKSHKGYTFEWVENEQ